MSRRASRLLSWWRCAASCLLAWLAASPAAAQTIADYSRVQRALLENAMTQAAARSAGAASSAPSPAPAPAAAAAAAAVAVAAAVAAATAAASPVPAPVRLTQALLAPAPPSVQVSGVFAAGGGALAEIVVNATPYLLATGDGVPGTTWQVESVAIDRVVLARRPGALANGEAAAWRKVFPLPAWH